MSYRVALDVFEGPFDLLLQLIAKRKLDISEVDLAHLTADFLAHLEGLEELDLDTATHFIVVAATLIELKAVRLLPAERQDELEDLLGEARDLLYARLLEYRAFRDAATSLGALFAANEGFHGRDVPLEPRFRGAVPDTPLTIDASGLAALAAAARAPRDDPHIDLSHVKAPALTIRDAAVRVLGRLPDVGAETLFRELLHGAGRDERVAVFLAVLELYKIGHVDLAQPGAFGPMRVSRARAGIPVGIAMLGADVDGEPDGDGDGHGGEERACDPRSAVSADGPGESD